MTKILIQQIISLPFDKQETYANVVNYDYKMWIISTYKIDICWLSSESSIFFINGTYWISDKLKISRTRQSRCAMGFTLT